MPGDRVQSRPRTVPVPDDGPALADVVTGAASLALLAAARTGGLVTRPLRSGLGRLPRLRLRVGLRPVDDLLRALDERGRLERSVTADRAAAAGSELLPALVRAVLERVDLAALIAEHVDLDAIADGVDLDRIVERLDLIALARYVVDGIDLPDLVRESTGSMTSEMVHSARMQTMDADHVVERAVDRILLRRAGRRAVGAAHPAGSGPDGR